MCREEAIDEALFAMRHIQPRSDEMLIKLINKIYDQQDKIKFITQVKRAISLLVPQKTLEDANDLIDAVFMIIADAIEDSELENKNCDAYKYLNNRTKYHDCEFDTCSIYSNLRNYPDMYKEKEL
jgi:hypothetical protein